MTESSKDELVKLREELDDYRQKYAELKNKAVRFAATKKLQNALFRIVDIANSSKNLSDFYQQLHQVVAGLTSAENFYIAIYDSQNNSITFPYYIDPEDDQQKIDDPLHNKNKVIKLEDIKDGPTGRVIRQGQLLHLNKQQMDAMPTVGRNAEEWLGIPLIQDNQVLGALVVQSYQLNFKYSERDENLLIYVSQHIAAALKRKQDSEALKQAHIQLKEANQALENRVSARTQELNQMNHILAKEVTERIASEKIQKALFHITDLVSTASGLNDLFEGVHQTISELMYADNAFFAIVSDDQQYLDFPYFADKYDARPGKIKLDLRNDDVKPSLTVQVICSGKPLLISKENNPTESWLGPEAISWLGVPLMDQEQCFGVIAVQSYDPEYIHDEQNLSVLKTIAKQVSTAILRKKDADALKLAHEHLERRVRERTSVLERTIIKRRRIEKQLEHESQHDSLTQLPNRKFLSEQLKDVLNDKATTKDCDIALLFLDLDRFKIINDSLGHHIGDLFLIEVAKRLKRCLRNDDIVVRLGGDEFCILMYDVESQDIAVGLAERVLNKLREPVEVEQHSLITSASIGVRLAKIGTDNEVQVIGDADSAMYQAKHSGKNCYCLFDANIKRIVSHRIQLEQDLRLAIGSEQITLHYQPIFDLFNDEIVGLEGLIRWQHPELGFVSPVEFIPIAEETGLIQELGDSVVDMACRTLHKFSNSAELEHLYVNVNISAIQILSRTLDEFIRRKITEYNIDPSRLNAEITESIMVEDFKAATLFVQELKSIGMKVILDDFGTGYSSLSYLHQFPFDYIKLDRSFIQSTSESPGNITLIESIGFLATNLGMDIVVEGIETEAQMNLAKNLNYRFAQGYLYTKPLPEEDIIKFIKEYAGSAILI